MSSSQFILHAPNVHSGGGLTLLKALIRDLPDHTCLIVDERLIIPSEILVRFQVRRVRPSVWHRFGAELLLKRIVKQGDRVLCFGNLPPMFRLKGEVGLFLQNRYLIDPVSLTSFPLKLRLRLAMERAWFCLFKNRVDQMVVQSATMQRLLESRYSVNAKILPFIANECSDGKHEGSGMDRSNDFIYVASGEPHKNHRNLVKAWGILATEGLHPSLILTLNDRHNNDLLSWIDEEKKRFSLNIQNLGSITEEEIFHQYMKAKALVFPSTLESFGLPLLEAKNRGLAIVASELDYVRDVIDPDETFDPRSPVSIARAVRRFMGEKESRSDILDAKHFLQNLFGDD